MEPAFTGVVDAGFEDVGFDDAGLEDAGLDDAVVPVPGEVGPDGAVEVSPVGAEALSGAGLVELLPAIGDLACVVASVGVLVCVSLLLVAPVVDGLSLIAKS